jgi:hypothetical protein
MAVTLLALVGAMAFGLLSMALGFWIAFTLWYTLRSDVWRTTPGIVTDSRVASNRRANGLPGHHYVVGYEFPIAAVLVASMLTLYCVAVLIARMRA